MKPIEFVYDPMEAHPEQLASFTSEWAGGKQYIRITMPAAGSLSFSKSFWEALNNHVMAAFDEPVFVERLG